MPDINWTRGKVKENSNHKQLHYSSLNRLNEFHLWQAIAEPTHVLDNILDLLCISNPDGLSEWIINDPGLSDHFMTATKLLITTKSHEIRPKIVKGWWEAVHVTII